ncbi:MAG: GNAT family N-acetyltransferase [Pirellulales bacterium]|nr:GNAT family N-acetyltransferase [Pirellulales bacterium]
MLHVRQIETIDELAHYRMAWNALLGETRQATFFQTFDWFEVYWKHFGHGQRMRVLVVLDGDRPIGIVPLVIRTESTRAGEVRLLTYPLDNWGSFYGPIGPNPTVTLRLAMRHVRQTPRDWDIVDLRWVDRTGCDHGRTEGAMEAAGMAADEQPWDETAVVDLGGTWDAYWRGRSKKWRKNLRASLRRLETLGRVTYVRYRPEGAARGDGDPRWDVWEACLTVARKSWQGSSETGTTLCHPQVEPFLRDAHAAAARCGALDVNLLLVDGQPVAFVYNYHFHGRSFGLRMGFDPSLAGAGSVLAWRMLEDAFARGDDEFDLGTGSLECKEPWYTSLATSYRYTHFPMSLRAQTLRAKRWYQRRRFGRGYLAGSKTQPHVA